MSFLKAIVCVVCLSAGVCLWYTVYALFSLRGAAVRCSYSKDCSMIHWKTAPQEVWGEDEGQCALRCIGGCQIMIKSPSSCTLQYANLLEGYRGDVWLMNSTFKRLLQCCRKCFKIHWIPTNKLFNSWLIVDVNLLNCNVEDVKGECVKLSFSTTFFPLVNLIRHAIL